MFFSLLSLNYNSEINDHISEVSEQASQVSKVNQQITESIEETSLSCNAASENCDSASAISMSLASFEDEQSFESLKNLIFRVNEQVESRDYAVVLDRIKKSKLDVRRKA
jgi:type VI protein secretion system component VasK